MVMFCCDVLLHVGDYATTMTLCAMSLTSTIFRDASEDDALWEPIYARRYRALHGWLTVHEKGTVGWKVLLAREVRDRQGSVASDGGSREVPAPSFLTRMWGALRRQEGKRAVCVGLDDAGKTTMAYYMKRGQDEVEFRIPTVSCNHGTVSYRGWDITEFDLGGQEKIRPLRRHYFQAAQAVVFVVNSTDDQLVERLDTMREELRWMLEVEEELRDVPILFLCNKQDMPRAVGPRRVAEMLSLRTTYAHRVWRVMPCCALTGAGVDAAWDWLFLRALPRR